MDAQICASIDIYERVLRYAEVERYGSKRRLLRLGSCDFDFSVTEGLLYSGDRSEGETVAEALSDVFAGSSAHRLRVVVHPSDGLSFFSPVPAGLDEEARLERLRHEAALLARSGREVPSLHVETQAVQAETLPSGEPVEWMHVLALPEAALEQLERILDGLSHASFEWCLSTQAVGRAVGELHEQVPAGTPVEEETSSYTLAIGGYARHMEFTLNRGRHWRFSHHSAATTPADGIYFAVALLERFGLTPSDVGRVFVYGPSVDLGAFQPLQRLFGIWPERIDPIRLLDLDPESLLEDFDASAYAPSLGAVL